ncbi:MAG: response regulator, partial [Candidatus Cloacimonetes bacterium]|nr:response regulator [Candidatus Cloacimonadota bacterium]
SIIDNGCGIPKEHQSKLFEPFFTTKAQGKGLGLGLPNVISIVKSSGGGIGVESTPGLGTTFKILLPYCDEQHVSEDMEPVEKDLNGNGELILVVEDEEALSLYFQKMISKFGYKVQIANSGAEALLLLGKGLQPALVITDIIMPGMNGKDLADRIVQNYPEQKVMFMSGFTDDIIQPLGVIRGNIPFLQKPFTAPELAKTIKTLLTSHQVINAKPALDAAETKVKILMLDDDESLQILFQRACNKIGHKFLGVKNLSAALLELNKQKFDVLLIDDNLEGITGADALKKIRAEGHHMPAIGISGVLNAEHVKNMEDAGMIKVIEKSFDLIPLLNAAVEAAKHLYI